MTGVAIPPGVDELLVDVVTRWAGAAEAVRGWAWPHGGSRVLRLRTPRGDVVAKWIAAARTLEYERLAMERYAPALGSGAAQLLRAEPPVLVLTLVPGEPAEDGPAEHDPEVHRQAGALIRALHRSAPVEIAPRWGEDLLDRFDRWAARASGLITPDDLHRAREIAGRARDLGPVELVPAHRDNSPRNWLVQDGRVRLIDFGHCKPAPWVVDLHRLDWRQWAGRPGLRAAFLDGYGAAPSEHDRAVLRAHDAQAAVSTVVWATEHDDPGFAAEGRAVLARLLSGG